MHTWSKLASLILGYAVKIIKQELFFCLKYNFWRSHHWHPELFSLQFCDFDLKEMLALKWMRHRFPVVTTVLIVFLFIYSWNWFQLPEGHLFNTTFSNLYSQDNNRNDLGYCWDPPCLSSDSLEQFVPIPFILGSFTLNLYFSRLKIRVCFSLLSVTCHPWRFP